MTTIDQIRAELEEYDALLDVQSLYDSIYWRNKVRDFKGNAHDYIRTLVAVIKIGAKHEAVISSHLINLEKERDSLKAELDRLRATYGVENTQNCPEK